MAKRSFFIKESEMDDFQRKVINRRSESSLIVKGCAGSGKSVLAFWRLHDIVSNDKGSAQIVVFTKSLKSYFVEGCRGEGIDSTLIDYWEHWKREPRSTDYILVDEAQDFSANQIRTFMQHANKALLLYGDSSQQIYNFLAEKGEEPRASMEEIGHITGFPDERLVFNHRLPAKVARVAEYANTEGDNLEERCKEEGVEKPYFLTCPTGKEQLDLIAEIVRARGYEDVGILLPKNKMVESVAGYLKEKGLSVEAKYNTEDKGTVSNLNFATSNPKVMTYHSAKGLQFGAVFLPRCEDVSVGDFMEPLYVAMTRTYQALYVMYSTELPKALQNVPAEHFETNYRPKETELL